MKKKPGAQLYIFSRQFDMYRDIDQMLDGLVQAGFEMIEDGPEDAAYYRPKLDARGLGLCGVHRLTPRLRDLKPIIAYMHEMDTQDLNVSGPLEWFQRSAQDYREAIMLMNEAGKVLRDEGIFLHYHNHDFEFASVEGRRTAMDLLLAELDFQVVDLCFDIGLAWLGGADPLVFLREHGHLIGYLHVRDFRDKTSVELGRGQLPLPDLIRQSISLPRVRQIVAEQDPVSANPIQSMAISRAYLRTFDELS